MRHVLSIHLLLSLFVFPVHSLHAEGFDRSNRESPHWLLPVPELDADPDIPTLEEVLGHRWGLDITSPAGIEEYARALARAAPERARWEPYGRTYEGRPLGYLVITSPANLRRIEEIRKANLRLADPLATTVEEASAIATRAPAIIWLAHSIHGNETSPGDAALLTAYHLLADRRAETREQLERLVVIIDPLQNPDGRQRFISAYHESRGVFPQSEPYSSERMERWPGGRFNHYLFDMNRDWFLHSQTETRGKIEAYLRWKPQIYVDAHEMGYNSHYYFAPSADPVNPQTLPRQREWLHRLGERQGLWFDRFGFSYTTREIFDAFYPGYGSEWPNLHGVMGVLWEQAGVRGLVVEREDETRLHFHDAVRHHYISALATIELASQEREGLLKDYHDSLRRGVRLGEEGPVRDFFILEGRRPGRAARLARLLQRNGVQVRRISETLRVTGEDVQSGDRGEHSVPAGSYRVPVAQAAGRLVRSLLDRHVDMGQEFVERQIERKKRRLGDEIYDVTSWSLPLAFGVDCVAGSEAVEVKDEPYRGSAATGEVHGGYARVAYLALPEDDGIALALASWLRKGLRVHVADRALRIGEVDFPRGTIVLKVHENPPRLHQIVREAAKEYGIEVHATDTGFVTRGAHLGGPHVRWVRPPEVLLLVDRPTSYSVGHTWYLFDQVLRYPTTRVPGRLLERVDLDRYNVLILPEGSYDGEFGSSMAARLREWVRRGGTLVLVGGATAWATEEKVNLLATRPIKKTTPWRGEAAELEGDERPGDAEKPEASGSGEEKLTETPDAVPGAFLRAAVFEDHWVTFGYGEEVDVLLDGSLILEPLRPTDGRNLVTFVDSGRLLTSGFCWPRTLELIAGTPYVVYQSLGRGHVIGFLDDPNYRAMYPAVQRLFINAVFFGPGY